MFVGAVSEEYCFSFGLHGIAAAVLAATSSPFADPSSLKNASAQERERRPEMYRRRLLLRNARVGSTSAGRCTVLVYNLELQHESRLQLARLRRIYHLCCSSPLAVRAVTGRTTGLSETGD
ncbi:hypothetical protein HPB50_007613 [Hyalomma asiaticum]|uniref:Uncharacterized protein n=1 Tax=Hyalomma asiaticum TaxID=266040 RepID=A0ACB7SFR2_HYAAI|nr:hypothetical protein HPB50_007613 [Hyalomma asiaticum]